MQRPSPSEHNTYFKRYIDLVRDGDFFEIFDQCTATALRFFDSVPAEKQNYRYAEGKWTVKDILMHLIDVDRVFTYRALVAARGDSTTLLASMDEDDYARNVDVTNRSMESLLQEFITVRNGLKMLLQNLTEEQSQRPGNGVGHIITPRAIGYILVGHVEHHLKVIQERYL